jgi:hypothetical protein
MAAIRNVLAVILFLAIDCAVGFKEADFKVRAMITADLVCLL